MAPTSLSRSHAPALAPGAYTAQGFSVVEKATLRLDSPLVRAQLCRLSALKFPALNSTLSAGLSRPRPDNSMHHRKCCLTISLSSMSFSRLSSLALCRNRQAMATLRPHASIVSEEIMPPQYGHSQAVSRCGLLQHPRVKRSIPGEDDGRAAQKLCYVSMDLRPRGRAGGFQCLPSESVQVSCAACDVALWEAE